MKLIGRDMTHEPNREALYDQPETDVIHIQDGDFKICIHWDYTRNKHGQHDCRCVVLDGNFNLVFDELGCSWTCSVSAIKWYISRAKEAIQTYDPS